MRPPGRSTSEHEPRGSITRLLRSWRKGDDGAVAAVVERVYGDLTRLARAQLRREGAAQSIEAPALVHEAFLRLHDARDIDWQSRTHFIAVASRVMRRVLVECGRARGRRKRRGLRVPLTEGTATSPALDTDVLDLDAALLRLEQDGYERECRVVELRFFGGLSEEETARFLELSPATARRAWSFARARLYRDLSVGS